METMIQYKVHPEAEKLPKMTDKEFSQLCESIKNDGLQEEIIILTEDDPQIIDGRHRYKACIETGIPPRFITLIEYHQANAIYLSGLDLPNSKYLEAIENGDIDQLIKEIIKIKNVYRRADNTYNTIKQHIHLLPKNGQIGKNHEKSALSHGIELKTAKELAEELGLSEATINRVKAIEENATPDIKAMVEAREIGIKKAEQLTRELIKNQNTTNMAKTNTPPKAKKADWFETNVQDEAKRYILKTLIRLYKRLEAEHGIMYIKMLKELVNTDINHTNYKEKWNQVN